MYFIYSFIELPVRGEHVAAAAELVPAEILQHQHSIVLHYKVILNILFFLFFKRMSASWSWFLLVFFFFVCENVCLFELGTRVSLLGARKGAHGVWPRHLSCLSQFLKSQSPIDALIRCPRASYMP
jgi:hypothetical protein